jgi:hypothetical protein
MWRVILADASTDKDLRARVAEILLDNRSA